MASTQTIRRLTIEGRTTGVNEAAASLDALSRAQTKVSDTAQGMAVATDSSAKRALSAAGAYDRLLKSVDDNYRTQSLLTKGQITNDRALQQGVITAEEHASTLAKLSQRFGEVSQAANENTKQLGLARHEMINLSRQAQDVVVSLQGGQGLGTVLLQQGSQIGDVFATTSGTVSGFFKQVTGYLGSFLSVGRLAFGGVAAAIGVAAMALNSYLGGQQKVQLALTGAGRASGASATSVNAAASAGSAFGLSVSSARELASALAATGKVANDNLLPIVKLGHDFATTFGVDAADATKMLAQAFSDPVKGAEQLNDRLGFLDAAMQRQIASLVAQNRMYEAQQVLLTGVQGSLARTAEVTSLWSQAWNAVKNAGSNAFDKLGEKIADYLHLNDTLEQQREASQKRLASYSTGLGRIFGSSADYESEKRNLAEINALIERRAQATQNAAAAQASLRQQATIMAQLPDVGQRQTLSDQAAVAGAVAEDPLAQRALGITQAQADKVRGILNQIKGDYKTTFEEIQQNSKIAIDAVTAFSPAAKALIAARQATEQYRASGGIDPTEKAKISQDAYNLSLKQSVTALSEAARARTLSAQQSVQSAQLEIDLVGKGIGQQAEMRANLQARQALEQQASQNRTAIDEAEYDRLKKINAEAAKRAQTAAVTAANSNVNFDINTAFLSDAEKQIASLNRQLHGDDWKSYSDDALSNQMRIANGMRDVSSLLQDVNRGIFTDFSSQIRNGASAFDALKTAGTNALGKIADKLASMAADNLWAAAFGGSSGGLGSFFSSIFGGGGVNANGSIAGAIGPTSVGGAPLVGNFASGGYTGPGSRLQPAGIVHAGEYVFSQASVGRIGLGNLDRLHRGYADGGPVLPLPVAANTNAAGGGASAVHITVGVSVDDDGKIQAYVKDVSQKTVNSFAQSPSFVGAVGAASQRAKSLRQL